MKITYNIEQITPENAKQILSLNVSNNRPLAKTHVEYLAGAMDRGEWQVNGEAIVFSEAGNLIDGQHRLHAIIKHGKPITTLVVRGISESAFATIDRGKSRSPGNIFATAGILNYNTAAAAAQIVISYRDTIARNDGKGGSLNTSTRISGEVLLSEYEKHCDKYQFCCRLAVQPKPIIAPSVIAGVAAIAMIDAGRKPEEVSDFWQKVKTGEGIFRGDPAYTLRETMQSFKNMRKPTAVWQIMAAIKAWNYYAQSKPLKIIKIITGEPVQVVK